MNVKDFSAILEKLVRSRMPYGYDNTDNLLIGINIDGKVCDIDSIRIVAGGFVIEPLIATQSKQQPKLLQSQKKSVKKEEEENNEESSK